MGKKLFGVFHIFYEGNEYGGGIIEQEELVQCCENQEEADEFVRRFRARYDYVVNGTKLSCGHLEVRELPFLTNPKKSDFWWLAPNGDHFEEGFAEKHPDLYHRAIEAISEAEG